MKTFTTTLRIGFGSAVACTLIGFAFRNAGQPGAALAAAYCGTAALVATGILSGAQISLVRRRRKFPR